MIGVIVVCAVMAILLIYLPAHSPVQQAGFVDFAGTVQTDFRTPLGALAHQVTIASQQTGSGPFGTQGLSWAKTSWSGLQYIFFLGTSIGQHVRLTNTSTGVATGYNASSLLFGFDTFPTCRNVYFSNSQYVAQIQSSATNHLVQIVYADQYYARVRITPTAGQLYSSLAITASPLESASAVSFTCDRVNMTANGTRVLVTGSTNVYVSQFSAVNAQLYLAINDEFGIGGPSTLSLTRGSANWTGPQFAASTGSGDIPAHDVTDILSFDTLRFALPAEPTMTRNGVQEQSLGVVGTQARILTLDRGVGFVDPTVTQVYTIPIDENSRQAALVLVSLILGALLPPACAYIWRIYQFDTPLKRGGDEGETEPKPSSQAPLGKGKGQDRIQRAAKWAGVVALAILLVLAGVAVVHALINGLVLNQPGLFYMAHYPVRVNVLAESSTNTAVLEASYAVLLPVLEAILANNNITLQFSVFPEDGISNYSLDSVCAPEQTHDWDPLAIHLSGEVNLDMVHHEGFLGSNRYVYCGATIVFFDGPQVAPLEEALTLLQAIAYSWGLPYDPCSSTMSGGGAESIPAGIYTASPWNLSGEPIYLEVLNHTFQGEKAWGTLLVSAQNFTLEADALRSETQDTYLFGSNTTGFPFYEVIHLRDRGSDASYDWDAVQVSYALLQTYARGWTAGELEYIYQSIQGISVPPPVPAGGGC